MSYETLEFGIKDSVARITLARPDRLNAANLELMRELFDVSIRCDEDPTVRAALLTGSGRAFCAGGDLKSFAGQGDQISSHLKEAATFIHAAVSHFLRMDAPLVTAVNGVAAGAGLPLAVAGDLVLAAESASFTMAYTAAGLTPDGGSTYLLPRLIGLRRTQELMLTNRRLSAAEALDWGLVTRVVADDQLLAEAEKLAAQLAAGPTRTYGVAKNLLLRSTGDDLEGQMELEARAIAAAAGRPDGREGVQAFLDKRAPSFSGE